MSDVYYMSEEFNTPQEGEKKMYELLNLLKNECIGKSVKFRVRNRLLEISVEGEVVWSGDRFSEEDNDFFGEVEAELGIFYLRSVERKVRELTGITELESEFDPDFADYIDVYTETLYEKRLVSVKFCDFYKHEPNYSIAYYPLNEVLCEVEEQLKEVAKELSKEVVG